MIGMMREVNVFKDFRCNFITLSIFVYLKSNKKKYKTLTKRINVNYYINN